MVTRHAGPVRHSINWLPWNTPMVTVTWDTMPAQGSLQDKASAYGSHLASQLRRQWQIVARCMRIIFFFLFITKKNYNIYICFIFGFGALQLGQEFALDSYFLGLPSRDGLHQTINRVLETTVFTQTARTVTGLPKLYHIDWMPCIYTQMTSDKGEIHSRVGLHY